IRLLAVKELENLCLDISRNIRKGIPEIILAEGKLIEDVIKASRAIFEENGHVIISRVNENLANIIMEKFGNLANVIYYEKGRIIAIRKHEIKELRDPPIGIITAGTADIRIAEEARAVINELGFKTLCYYDVGIAGPQRVYSVIKKCIEEKVEVAIVIAGMEGALPSVFSSLFPGIVIGVPSSVGYGYGGGGIAALMAMLQSCTPGMVVVNIDNGVGAAIAAVLISRLKS
ncbi:MAG: nickel pincer cofactor biosynthesis protein LarB, partial [Candidatus Methanomethylicaceae archaeon]